MSVDQAAYRPFEGTRRPGRGVVSAIAETMIRRVLRQKWIRSLTGAIVLMNVAMGASINLIVNSRSSDGATIGDAVEQLGGGKLEPFVISLRGFIEILFLFTPAIAALTVGPLIAEDRRARALPLYFSRPIRHWQYMVGKLAAGAFFLAALTMIPPVAVFGMEIANAPDMSIFADRLGLLSRALVPCLLITVACTSIALGISSLMERTNAASMLVFCVLVFPMIAVNASYESGFTNPTWLAIDPFNAVVRIAHELLPPVADSTENAYGIPLAAAWQSILAWTGVGMLLLGWRVRNVEVVA